MARWVPLVSRPLHCRSAYGSWSVKGPAVHGGHLGGAAFIVCHILCNQFDSLGLRDAVLVFHSLCTQLAATGLLHMFAAGAGRAGGRLVEGQAGLPPVGCALSTRCWNCWPEQPWCTGEPTVMQVPLPFVAHAGILHPTAHYRNTFESHACTYRSTVSILNACCHTQI